MKKMVFASLFALFLLSACSSITVNTDFDPEANFRSYETYGWMPMKDRPRDPLHNTLTDARIKRAIQAEMEGHGYRFVDKGRADLRVAFHYGIKTHVDVHHYGYSRWRGPRHTEVRRYKEGTLIIDLVDTREKQLVFRGWASGLIRGPETADKKINESVKAIFEKYPPQ